MIFVSLEYWKVEKQFFKSMEKMENNWKDMEKH